MSSQRCEQFIDGKFVPSESGEYFPLINPENGEITAEIARSTPGCRDRCRGGKRCREAFLLAQPYGVSRLRPAHAGRKAAAGYAGLCRSRMSRDRASDP